MAAARKPSVGITLGDPSGIGPEVVARAVRDPRVKRALVPVIFGDVGALEPLLDLGPFDVGPAPGGSLPFRHAALIEHSRLAPADRRPGRPTLAGARAQLAYLRGAIAAAQARRVDALCTAPVSKEQVSRTGVRFVGHTELLAQAFGAEVLMLMDGPKLKVALATNHVPLRQVAAQLSARKLTEQLLLLSRSLRPLLGRAPRIAVCGLNPHAGEGGLAGDEERRIIAPAMTAAKRRGVRCDGPWPADGLFGQRTAARFDVALAMYHDQGLVVVKALDFDRTVNVTLGLPVPRTSPDHGTAYALAGQGRASAEPMVAALIKAAELARAAQRM